MTDNSFNKLNSIDHEDERTEVSMTTVSIDVGESDTEFATTHEQVERHVDKTESDGIETGGNGSEDRTQRNTPSVDETLSENDAASVADIVLNHTLPSTSFDLQGQDRASRGAPSPSDEDEKSSEPNGKNDGTKYENRFEILAVLGSGGMGQVFKAFDTELRRVVALKVLKLNGRNETDMAKRFRQEAIALAKLRHPNIITLYDRCIASDGQLYFHSEYVEGFSLSVLLSGLRECGQFLPTETVLAIVMQALNGLEYMHQHKIIHRDVKPANIVIEYTGIADSEDSDGFSASEHAERFASDPQARFTVKLVDFGLAKVQDKNDSTMMDITKAGQTVGTVAYMSPEQCWADDLDGRADIYSLGCVLFEMLSGHVPFRGENPQKTMELQKDAPLPLMERERPDLEGVKHLDRVLRKMLAKNRDHRYSTAGDAKVEIEKIYSGITGGSMPEPEDSDKSDADDESTMVSLNNSQQSATVPIAKSLSDDDPFADGKELEGKYQIVKCLGAGGMGVVYKATQVLLNRAVAIKVLKSTMSGDDVIRFQREGTAIASIQHRNVIAIHDLGIAEGKPYFVLEYLEGQSLSQILRNETLTVERILPMMMQICDALHCAHKQGVIHRDIKPSNLMVVRSEDGEEIVKLLDFGIAKIQPPDERTYQKFTKTGELFGSPNYMSPEQCRGGEIAKTSDIYSLGCMLYEMLTGKPPFQEEQMFATIEAHLNNTQEPLSQRKPDLPEVDALDALLNKMLAKTPAERHQDATEVRKEIERIVAKVASRKTSPRHPRNQLEKLTATAFPNGLQDSKGRRTAIILAALLVPSLGLAALNTIPNLLETLPSPTVNRAIDKTPWRQYDSRGQDLFNLGDYTGAEESYQKALKKAQSESGSKQVLHMNTTLRELRTLYRATDNKQKFDWTNRELVDWFLPSPVEPKIDWDNVLAKADQVVKTRSPEDLASMLSLTRRLAIDGTEASRKKNTRKMIEQLIGKFQGVSDSKIATDQLLVLDTIVCSRESIAVKGESKSAISDLLKVEPEKIAPDLLYLLACVSMQYGINLTALEDLLVYATEKGPSSDRLDARIALSNLYWDTGRKQAAIDSMGTCLKEVQLGLPRDYPRLFSVLLFTSRRLIREREPVAAVPMLIRCKAISECEKFDKLDGRAATDEVMKFLAGAYTDMHKSEDAERILLALIDSYDRTGTLDGLEKARWQAQLGFVYCQNRDFQKALTYLEESTKTFEKNKTLPLLYKSCYEKARANLELTRAEMSKPALSRKRPSKNQNPD